MLTPELHDSLRREMGLDPIEYCANCWHTMDGGECPECGSTEVYDF